VIGTSNSKPLLKSTSCWSSLDSEVRIRGRRDSLRTSESELQCGEFEVPIGIAGQVRDRNFKFKAATQIKKLLELL
jgi:hypothetical protein